MSKVSDRELIKLNLGCGLKAPLGWVNIDNSFTMRLSKIKILYKLLCKIIRIDEIRWPPNIYNIDVRKGLPFKDESVKAIFTAHMLEHMSHKDANFLIRDCYRILGSGGLLRIIVPDLYRAAKNYIKASEENPTGQHSYNFLNFIGLVPDKFDKSIIGGIMRILRRSKHYYMYDEWSLKQILEKNGFIEIKKMDYGQSRIPDIGLLEDQKIISYEDVCAVCLESIK